MSDADLAAAMENVVEEAAAALGEEPTAVPSEAEPAGESATGESDDDPPSAYIPATTLTAAAEVRADDWVKGAMDDPLIVIVEYGDFQ